MLSYTLIDLLALLIVTTGIALQAIIGIGFGLVAAPLLYLLDPAYVPAPVLITGFMLSVIIVLQQRQSLQWRRVMPAILARLPGAWLGAWLLLMIPPATLSLLFGSAILLAVAISLRSFHFRVTPLSLTIGGFISGAIGTATSVGGPPMALVYQHEPRHTARNEIAAFFLIGTPGSIVMLAMQGGIDQHSLLLSLKMLPGVGLGWALSRLLERRLNMHSARTALLLVSSLSALLVIYDGIHTLVGAG